MRPILDEQRTGEPEGIDGNPRATRLAARDQQQPVAGDQQVVRRGLPAFAVAANGCDAGRPQGGAVAGVQGFRPGARPGGQRRFQRDEDVPEGQPRHGPNPRIAANGAQQGGDGQGGTGLDQGQRDPLQVFVWLAGAGRRAAVVEAEPPTVGQAETQGLEVGPIQQGLLVDEAPGDDQQVVIDDVELVQQG